MASKKSRRAAAKRAMNRIPIVGTAVAVAPLVRALNDSGLGMGNIGSKAAWESFFRQVIFKFTGVDVNNPGGVNGGELITTYAPVVAYAVSGKLGVKKHFSRILGRFGLRF